MIERWRTWLEDTHGATFELVRHFAGCLFDSEMLSIPGEWVKVAAGIFAVLVSAIYVALPFYNYFFNAVDGHFGKARVFLEIRDNEYVFIAVAAAITALLTTIQWQSLFPTRRDCLALAGLPVSARQMFLAKFGALTLAFVVFVLAMNLPWAVGYSLAAAGHWQNDPSALAVIGANFGAMAGACIFVFFSLLAVQGIMLNILPARAFGRASLGVQSVVLILTMGALPLVFRQPTSPWWPPIWFRNLWEGIIQGCAGGVRSAVLAMTVPAVVAVLAYLLSYQRYRRLLLETPERTGGGSGAAWVARLLEWWIPDPRQQAAFAFIWKTLARSRTHRLILLAYGGLALGAITKGALDVPRPSLHDQGMYGLIVALAPLALSLLLTVGLRYLFSLPDSVRANWLFQTMDRDGSAAWLDAVERFVVWSGIAPVFGVALPAGITILGWVRAAAVTLLGFFAALVWFEAMFREWRKLPFTCSYLPGKQPVWAIVLRYAVASSVVVSLAQLILFSSSAPMTFLALLTFEAALWWRLRTARRRMWSECRLCYEELPEPDVMTLGLRQPTEPVSDGRIQFAVSDASFQPTLLGRRFLPEGWRDEFRQERLRPSVVLETLWEDVRFGCRLIRRNPLFAAIVVLTLTVGIGINASVFTVLNAVALRPHVSTNPASFVRITPVARRNGTPRSVSFEEYGTLRDESRTVHPLAAITQIPVAVGDDINERVGLAVSCNFFAVEGLDRPLLGRLFGRDDCAVPGQMPAAVISESLWRNRFASDHNAIGHLIWINNRPAVLVGVIPDATSHWVSSQPVEAWLPYTAIPYFDPSRDVFHRDDILAFELAGRLSPGCSRADAEAEFAVLERQHDRDFPGRESSDRVTDGSWAADWELRARTRDIVMLAFFLATFNLVLVIACANVATLLLSRASARRHEIAVRLSLGAPRTRLIRMLLTESVLLAAAAGAISGWVASAAPEPLYRFLASRGPEFAMSPDWRTFAYIGAVVLGTGILAGLAPVAESLKVDLAAALKGQTRLLGGGSGARGLLVSAQVALSMVLLVEAALFARSEQRVLRTDPGFSPGKVVVTALRFPDNSRVETAKPRLDRIAWRMRGLPGVEAVAFSDGLPLGRAFTIELPPPSRNDASQPVDVYTVSPGFFSTMGIRIVRGRDIRDGETAAVVVSQRLAKSFWPRGDPIGRMLALPSGAAQIVGVAGDVTPVREGGFENPAVYRLRSVDAQVNVMAVHFEHNAAAGAIAIRAALHESEPDLLIFPFPLQDWIDRISQNLWNLASLIVVLGIVATVLAATGIYGAVSFAVSQRTRDLGIRVALGATRVDIMFEILVSSGKPVARGLIVGMWLAVPMAAALRESTRSSSMQIDNSEPLVYCAAALVLAAAAMLAMVGPIRRSASADPLEALHSD
jgi:predicted permease